MKIMMHSFTIKVGTFLVVGLLLVAIFAPWIAPHNPNLFSIEESFAPPRVGYWFGQDADGRDIFSRIVYGARVSLGIGIVVTLISLVFGCIIGLVSGYYGGFVDKMVSFISDVFLAFPSILFAITIAAFLSPSIGNVVLILSLKGWVTFARLVRGQTLSLKERDYVRAAKALGAKRRRLFLYHLLPNMIGPIVINASFGLAGVIIIESALSFLGLGVPIDTPSWGGMLDQGTQYLLIAPHLSLFPGVFIMLIVVGFNFLGDGLRDKLTPRGK